jgi:MFS transporter, DHA1 family, inner membrane transport protein
LLLAIVTNLPAGTQIGLVLVVTTGLFIATSGRMVPAMALITASTAPKDRGGFMSMNAAVQHLANGAATVVAGYLIVEQPDKSLSGFPVVGIVACTATAATLYLAGRLRPAPEGNLAPDAAEVDQMPEVIAVNH